MASSHAFGGIGRALSNRSFRYYFFGLVVFTSGFWASRVALAWLVWEITHSPTWLGLIVFVEVVPMIALAPVGGTVVDRKGALKICRLAQIGWCGVMAAFAVVTLTDVVSREMLVAVVFVEGLVAGFSNPSHLALVAKILPRQDLSAAVALQSAVVQTGRFVGPALAAPLLALYGAGIVFAVAAGTFAASTATLLLLRTHEPEHPRVGTRGFMGDFVDGFRYTLDHFAIRTVILYTAVMAVLLRPLVELLPGFVDLVFAQGKVGLAWLMAAFGLGSMVSAARIAFRGETRGLTRVFLVNLLIGAAALFAFALTTNFWIALAVTAVFGMATNTVSIASQTLAQNMVAGQMRARVMSILGMTFRAVPASGALVQGWAQSMLGLAAPMIAAAVLCFLAGLRLAYIVRTRNLAQEAEKASVEASRN